MTDTTSVINRVGDLYRQRQTLLTFELALQNQLDAKRRELTRPPATPKWTTKQANAVIASRPDMLVILDLWEPAHQGAIAAHHEERLSIERELTRLAETLPVYPWVAGVRGFSALGLAKIVGECGDLLNYGNPAKLWKRMGLGVLPDGTRQRRIAGVTEEEARAIAYVPQRRACIHVIGDKVMMGNRDGPYKTYYDAEKARQLAKWPEPVMGKGKDGEIKDIRKVLAHNRALRHMEKRLLRDLWRQWRLAAGEDPGMGWVEAVA